MMARVIGKSGTDYTTKQETTSTSSEETCIITTFLWLLSVGRGFSRMVWISWMCYCAWLWISVGLLKLSLMALIRVIVLLA